VDCDDADPGTYPGAVDICGDGIDQDCVGGDLLVCGPPDTCSDATGAPWTLPGVYADDASALTDDTNPEGVCISGRAAGRDAMYPVEVPPYYVLTATMTGASPAVYVLTDCLDEGTCVAGGSDLSSAEVVWYNPLDVPQAVTLVADHRISGGAYSLEIAVTPAPARMSLTPADTCAALLPGLALTTGVYAYSGDLTAYGSDHAPDAACTGYRPAGRDAVLPIRLEAGEQILVDYTNRSDSSVYILADCTDVDSCLVGADETLAGDAERLTLRNTTGALLEATLVLDAYSAGTSWELDVTIE
jgi:hypothetical protein